MPLKFLRKKSMYSEERRRKIDKKVEKTRTELRKKEEMQLKMYYLSFKKNQVIFFLQLNLHYWFQFTETICYCYMTNRAQSQRIQLIGKRIHKIDKYMPW